MDTTSVKKDAFVRYKSIGQSTNIILISVTNNITDNVVIINPNSINRFFMICIYMYIYVSKPESRGIPDIYVLEKEKAAWNEAAFLIEIF